MRKGADGLYHPGRTENRLIRNPNGGESRIRIIEDRKMLERRLAAHNYYHHTKAPRLKRGAPSLAESRERKPWSYIIYSVPSPGSADQRRRILRFNAELDAELDFGPWEASLDVIEIERGDAKNLEDAELAFEKVQRERRQNRLDRHRNYWKSRGPRPLELGYICRSCGRLGPERRCRAGCDPA